MLNMHPACELLSNFEHWITDEDGCTCIQGVSGSPFEQIRATDENGWTLIQGVSGSEEFEQIRTTDNTIWKKSFSLWVAVQCSRILKPLIRMAEHLSRMWVPLQSLSKSENDWTPVKDVSVWVLVDQNQWREWLNNLPGCELLLIVRAYYDCWCEWLNTHPVCESLSGVWADHSNTEENGLTHIQDVSPHQFLSRSEEKCWIPIQVVSCSSSVWESQNHWQEWLNVLLGSE